MNSEGVVIVGGGHAGFALAAALRSGGYQDPVRIVSDEAAHPYARPSLSKGFLLGQHGYDGLKFREDAYYRAEGIDVLQGRRVSEIALRDRRVGLSDGTSLPYGRLVLATGARNRTLPVPGAEFGVGLRNVEDARAVLSGLGGAAGVLVIGGGFIGLEVAAAAAQLGRTVTVVEAQDRLLARAVPPPVADLLRRLHESHGVRFAMSCGVASLAHTPGGAIEVATSHGSFLADFVVVGVGVVPNAELAREAGLATDDGILVDGNLRTSDPSVHAIGDCARFRQADGVSTRIESVQNATDQARHVALQIIGGDAAPHYAAVPWFWSDQYDCKLLIVGLPQAAESLMIKTLTRPFSVAVASLRGDRLVALHTLNAAAEHMTARRAMAAGPQPTTADMSERGYLHL